VAQESSNINHIITRYIQALQEDIKVDEVILFGSYANGQANHESDIDLAVFSSDFGKNTLRELQLLARKKIGVDLRIEAFAYHPDQKLSAVAGSLLESILKKGRSVYRYH
jgi:predicted nucleotidyltransferase